MKPNRYASILEGAVGSSLDELCELDVVRGHWHIKDGKLFVEVGGQDFEFEFEKGDQTSEAIVLMLNMLPNLITVLQRTKSCG